MNENERIYKGLGRIGGFGIAMGVIMLVTGVTIGVLAIINGARSLALKKNIMI